MYMYWMANPEVKGNSKWPIPKSPLALYIRRLRNVITISKKYSFAPDHELKAFWIELFLNVFWSNVSPSLHSWPV